MKLIDIFRLGCCRSAVVRGLIVSAIVGTVLNVINQGDAILSGASPNLPKVLLTYLVPYLVSTAATILTYRDIRKNNEC